MLCVYVSKYNNETYMQCQLEDAWLQDQLDDEARNKVSFNILKKPGR